MPNYQRKTLRIDTSGFEALIRKLESLGGDVEGAVEKSLTKAGERIQADTESAMRRTNMPAHGAYWTGQTKKSVVTNPKVEWDGSIAEIGVGFDFSKPGAGGFLISGTPRTKPVTKLRDMYKLTRYRKSLQTTMNNEVENFILQKWEGK